MLIPGRQPSLILELAPLRQPMLRHVAAKAWFRFRSFVVTATPIMLAGSLDVSFRKRIRGGAAENRPVPS